MSIKGIDISHYQDPVDFEKAKHAGYEFVIIKATEGVGFVDPNLVQNVHGAHQAGLVVGLYTFLRGDTDAVAAANKLHETIQKFDLKFELPLALDFEENKNGPDPTHQQLDTIRTVLRQHGYRTLTYGSPAYITEHIPHDCKFCASDPLWLAEYGPTANPPKPWDKAALWQHTSTAHVAGIDGDVDEDLFGGTATAFKELAGTKPAVNARPLPDWYHRLLEYPPSALRDPGHVVVHQGQKFQEGEDVKALQRRLGIKVDGFYGPITASHVKGKQKLYKLTIDGIVGPATAKAIG